MMQGNEMNSLELYQKLKPFLAIRIMEWGWQKDKVEKTGRQPFNRECYPNVWWRLVWDPKRDHRYPPWGNMKPNVRPTYEQFCTWYRLDLEAL